MFSLILIHDHMTIVPSKFSRSRLEVLTEEINSKYANKVLPHVGLCIRLFKIETVGDGHVFPSDGSAIVEVSFVMVVFKPFVNEILVGKIVSCNADHIKGGVTSPQGGGEGSRRPPVPAGGRGPPAPSLPVSEWRGWVPPTASKTFAAMQERGPNGLQHLPVPSLFTPEAKYT